MTLPPVLALSHWLNLPGPAVDAVGGAAAAMISARYVWGEFAETQLGASLTPAQEPIALVIATLAGAMLGLTRHSLMFPEGGGRQHG